MRRTRGSPARARGDATRTRGRSARAGGKSARTPRDGTYLRIYAIVRRIPRGRVATYGQVAVIAGFAGQARLVGYALHALPDERIAPWHRVVGARGRLSLLRAGSAAGLTQRMRLDQEGVRLAAGGRVDLDVYGWRPGGGKAAGRKARRGAGCAVARRVRRWRAGPRSGSSAGSR